MSDARLLEAPPSRNGDHLRDRVQAIRLDGQLGAAKQSRGGSGWLGWGLAGLLAVTWAGVGIRSYKAPPAGTVVASAAPSEPKSSGPAVTPTNATTADAGTILVENKGYLTPARQLTVSPIDVGGRVIELNVVEGKFYKEGEILAVLDSASYKAMADETEATLAAARQRLTAAEAKLAGLLPSSVRPVEIAQVEAQLAESKAQRDRAADTAARLKSAGGYSPQELVAAKNDYLGAEARVAKLEADLVILKEGPRKEQVKAAEADVAAAKAEGMAAEARLGQARWRLDNCIIKAPISGHVLTKKAEKGNLVNPQAFAGGGSVCEMADLATLEVDIKIPEKDIGKLKVGQPCRIKPDAYPDRRYDGRLDRIMPTANRGDATVNVRVAVTLPPGEAPGAFLKPEMGAVVSFLPMK